MCYFIRPCELFAIFLLILCLSCIQQTDGQLECGERKIQGEFSNTKDVIDGRFPWHALIYIKHREGFRYKCGGSIIDNIHVLTAANCFDDFDQRLPTTDIIVYLGRTNLNETGVNTQKHKVSKLIPYPNYKIGELSDDIALIQLATNITMTDYIQPICLWSTDVALKSIIGINSSVVGFGDEKRYKLSNQLRETTIQIVDHDTCFDRDPEVYGTHLSYKMYCANLNVKFCPGFGGGGMVFLQKGNWFLRGIPSFSLATEFGECDTSKYTVFTDVAKYQDWLAPYVTATIPSNQLITKNRPKQLECGYRKIKTQYLLHNAPDAKDGYWPWHVALYQIRTQAFTYVCGGTIIDGTTILTAAHCLHYRHGLISKDQIAVHLGRSELNYTSSRTVIHMVSRLVPHPNFHKNSIENDIGLIKLSSSIKMTDYIQPVCLWHMDKSFDWITQHKGAVVGFGQTEKGGVSNHLREAIIGVVDHWTCIESDREIYGKNLGRNMICGKGNNNISPCVGDSGGGLVYEIEGSWYIRGIVSFIPGASLGECDITKYTVFTDVAKYRAWIAKYVEPTIPSNGTSRISFFSTIW